MQELNDGKNSAAKYKVEVVTENNKSNEEVLTTQAKIITIENLTKAKEEDTIDTHESNRQSNNKIVV